MMTKATLSILPALFILSACGGSDAPTSEEATTEGAAVESEFDQQLSAEEANAALDALEAEEATAPVE